jgi:hypothetical protein
MVNGLDQRRTDVRSLFFISFPVYFPFLSIRFLVRFGVILLFLSSLCFLLPSFFSFLLAFFQLFVRSLSSRFSLFPFVLLPFPSSPFSPVFCSLSLHVFPSHLSFPHSSSLLANFFHSLHHLQLLEEKADEADDTARELLLRLAM